MASELKKLARGTTYHGHAGQGSAFATVAHRKLKPGGVIALVLPFTAINGASWKKFRELMAGEYVDLSVVSIAANGDDMSFSSDTGIAECLFVARKRQKGQFASMRGRFTSLSSRPRGFAESSVIAQRATTSGKVRTIEDGPYGGTTIQVGEDRVGETINAATTETSTGWGAARLADSTVAQVAASISSGELWLPAHLKPIDLPVVRLEQLGELGVHDSMLTMATHSGPFKKEAPSPTATYPSLCNHDAPAETRMICVADSQMRVIPGQEVRADLLWTTASRTHLNRDFTFGAQALAVAFTEDPSLGGRVWPNIAFDDERFEYTFSIWANCSLGLLTYWWFSSRQQSSKASMTRLVIPKLPILDFRELTDDQLQTAEDIFDDFRERDLQPAYLADADPNRAHLDRRVVCDLLGFDESVYEGVRRLAAKWCAEPSVHGGKSRPPDAKLVI